MAKKVYIGAEVFQKIELPSLYDQIEYLEATGKQYIDTGFQPKGNTRVVIDIDITGGATYPTPFGAHTNAIYYSVISLNASTIRNFYAGSSYDISKSILGRHLIDKNGGVLSVDGIQVHSVASSEFTVPYSLFLFTFGSFETGSDFQAHAKLYSCKIYDNGTLVRDFVPAKYFNGKLGLYDIVNGAFYENAGTGSFTGGPTYEESLAREVKAISKSVNAVTRTVKSGHKGVDGVARQFWKKGGEPLGELAVGQTVYMKVNGVSKEFIVVNQGVPSSAYDSSCDGTWLLLKDCYGDSQHWDATSNDYATSDIHNYLNNTFVSLFDSDIQNIITQVKIPYRTGSSTSVASGSSGLSAKVFLLSHAEVGFGSESWVPVEGAALNYFNGATNSKRIAYDSSGTVSRWYLRTPYAKQNTYAREVYSDGTSKEVYVNGWSGVRPCIILPSDMLVDEAFNVVA